MQGILPRLHLPELNGILIFIALCHFFLLGCLLLWCAFTFCLSKYQRGASCKPGDLTFLQAGVWECMFSCLLWSSTMLDKQCITRAFPLNGNHVLSILEASAGDKVGSPEILCWHRPSSFVVWKGSLCMLTRFCSLNIYA